MRAIMNMRIIHVKLQTMKFNQTLDFNLQLRMKLHRENRYEL